MMMRPLILILAALAIGFTLAMAFGGDGTRGRNTPPPDFEPSAWMEVLGTLTGFAAPGVALRERRFALIAAMPPRPVELPAAEEEHRVLRVVLEDGTAALATYDCRTPGRENCRLTVCVATEGAPTALPGCPDAPRRATARLPVQDVGGVVLLQAIGGRPATVELR